MLLRRIFGLVYVPPWLASPLRFLGIAFLIGVPIIFGIHGIHHPWWWFAVLVW